MIPRDLIHYSALNEERKNMNNVVEPTYREKEPNKKVERVGGVLAFLVFLLIISLYGFSTIFLALVTVSIISDGVLYWSRRNREYLWMVVVGVVVWIFLFIYLLFRGSV